MSLDRRTLLTRVAAAVMLVLALVALGSRLMRPYRWVSHPTSSHHRP